MDRLFGSRPETGFGEISGNVREADFVGVRWWEGLCQEDENWLGRALHPAHPNLEEHEDSETDPDSSRRARIPLNPRGPQRIGEIELDPKTAALSHLLVQIPEKHHSQNFTVAIRQLYGGQEVGRVTSRLVPGL